MKKLSFLLSAAVAVVSFSVCAEYVVTWQVGETPATVADGHVALSYDANNAITSISATSDQLADRVIFTGDAMTLAADAVIVAPADTLVFSNAVTVADNGGVSFSKSKIELSYGNFETGTVTDEQKKLLLPVASPVLAFPNCKLDEIKLTSGAMYGGGIVNGSVGLPFHPKAVEGGVELQMQLIDGTYLKCVYVRLFQNGDDVYAQAVRATYGNADNANVGNHRYALGDDFDVYPGATGYSVATPTNPGGNYGVKGMKAVFSAEQRLAVEVAAPFTMSGTLSATHTAFAVSGDGSIGPDAATAPAMTLTDSSIDWMQIASEELTFANAISGTGSELSFARPLAAGDAIAGVDVNVDVRSVAVKLVAGISLDHVVALADPELMQNGTYQGTTTACFFERVGNKIQCQFQVGTSDNWNKCALMEITEEGGALYARNVRSYWKRLADAPVGETDFRVVTEGVTSNDSNYYPRFFRVVFDQPVRPVNNLLVNANAANTLKNSTITIGTNVNYTASHRDAIPCQHNVAAPTINSKVEVEAGGTLNLAFDPGFNTDGLNNGTLITVHHGGTLLQTTANVLQRGQNVVLDGGTLVLKTLGSDGDASQYVNRLTLCDGGRVTGASPRIGLDSALWQVKGVGDSCSVDDGVFLVRHPTSTDVHGTVWTLEVDDLTDDTEADLVLYGFLKDFPRSGDTHYYGMIRRKTGAGTLLLDENLVSTAITGRWEIVEGTVAVAGSDQLSAERGYSLALQGGTLELKAGTENSFAFFTDLTATSGLTLGENAYLQLPGAPQNWAADAMLQVSLAKGATLKVGDDASALTPDQLKKIRVNGVRARLTDDGCLRSDLGLMLLIR